jgi:hypothetical protein
MQINLKDFPDEVYVQLDAKYKDNLFKKLSKLRLDKLEKKIRVTKSTIIEWKKRSKYIPLGKVRKILSLINQKEANNLEKNIISYKTKKGKYRVTKPILPVKDCSELREIVVHIMCDGCFSGGYAAYYNIDYGTKKEFVNELKKCFGEVGFKIYGGHIHFPSVIALVLKHFFRIDFNSKRCRIPKEFLKGNKKELVGIIRAMIIDEGTIDGSNIRLDSCNKEFIENIKNVCKRAGYSCGKTWESKGPIFRFNILAKSIQQLKKDMKKLPIEKKQLLIDMAEKNQKRAWKYKLPGEVKKSIIAELVIKPTKTIELIEKIGLEKTVIGNHLRWLIKKDLVGYRTKNNIRTYLIKNKKKAKEFLKDPSKFIRSDKIKNYGKSQLKVLKMLNKNIKKYSEIERFFGFNKASTFKLISSLKKKGFIKKINKKGWITTNKGRKVLSLDENTARYLLYANIKEI